MSYRRSRSYSVSGRTVALRRSYYVSRVHSAMRQLIFDVELPDTLNLVSEEIDTVRIIVTVAIDIYDRSANGVLSGLEYKIHVFKTEF